MEERLQLPMVMDRANCAGCKMCGGHVPTQPVVGFGPANARLVVVGEAPGVTERRFGKPFSGPSGRLLWSELARLKTKPEWSDHPIAQMQVYGTNVLACPLEEGENIRVKDVAACTPRLLAELEDLEPQVILCLGSTAATVLRGKHSTITQLVGHTEWSERFNAHLAYTYNPAAVMHEPGLYQDFVWGVRRAVEALEYADGPREYPPIRFEVGSAHSPHTYGLLADARVAQYVVCDIETTGLRPHIDDIRSVGFAWSHNFSLILPWDDLVADKQLWDLTDAVLSRPDVIGHNYQFDCRFLRAKGFHAKVGGDTMLLHYALDERTGRDGGGAHDLKTLARKYEDAPRYAEGIERGDMAAVPAMDMYRYQAHDCVYTWRLRGTLTRLLQEEPESRLGYRSPLEMYQTILVPASNALSEMEQRGIKIDLRRLLELRKEYAERIETKREECRTLLGRTAELAPDFNPNSSQQIARVLYTSVAEGGFGFPIPPAGKGQKLGSKPTNEEAFHWLQRIEKAEHRTPNPLLDAILDYRSLLHTKATYLDGTAKRLVNDNQDGALRGHFHLPGTTSGRLSSSDPNLQNIPARSVIKELFIPRKGYTLVNADYRRLEVGVLAWFSEDRRLMADFMAEDFHWNVAQKVFAELVYAMGLARDDIWALTDIARRYPVFTELAQRQSRESQRVTDPATFYDMLKEMLRRQAKYISFGKMYGEGAVSLAAPEKGMGVPVEVAERYSRLWDEQYPQAVEWLKGQVRLAKFDRWLETPAGRRRRFGYPTSIETHLANEAMNFPIQSLAAEMCLASLTSLQQRLPEEGLGYPLLTVHDSILFELLTRRLEEAKSVVHDVMTTRIIHPYLVFEIDMKSGMNWAAAH